MAYRTDVRRFTDTLASQSERLGRLMELQKDDGQVRQARAGSTRASLFKEELTPEEDLIARFAIELLQARLTGRAGPDMDKLVKAMRAHATAVGGIKGNIFDGIADLGEVTWALPRMWDQPGAPKLGKGYPEYHEDQARGNDGRWVSGGGSGGSSSVPHRGMGARRGELFDAYKLKFGYFPPRGMTNQRVEMWVKNKAPAGPDVTHEVRGALAEYRHDEPWSTTFKRAGHRILENVYNWGTSPVIVDTVVTLGLYALAVEFLPAAAGAVGLKHALNDALNIALRRRNATSAELITVIDGLKNMLRRPRAGWFG